MLSRDPLNLTAPLASDDRSASRDIAVTSAHLAFTEAERQRRKKAVDTARASVRLSGFILDDATEAIYARYIDGHLEMTEVIAQVCRNAGLED